MKNFRNKIKKIPAKVWNFRKIVNYTVKPDKIKKPLHQLGAAWLFQYLVNKKAGEISPPAVLFTYLNQLLLPLSAHIH